jgi:hypothetical protein
MDTVGQISMDTNQSLSNFYASLFRKRPLMLFGSIFIYVGVLMGAINFEQQEREQEKLSSSKFREIVASEIMKSIQTDTDIEMLSDQIKVIFSSYDRKSKGQLGEYGLVSILEDAFAENATNPQEAENLKILMALLAKQKEKYPYYGLKLEQEVIIKSLEKELCGTEGYCVSNNVIEQMKEVVRRQNFEIDELKISRAWGLPMGIAGIIATILFGMFAFLYPVWRK